MACKSQIILVTLVLCLLAPAALADGMIVPVRPDLRVRGPWAVKYHHVDIRVRDQIANVSITQEFVNTGSGMIEVEYFFPVPPGAAIDSMTLIVDGKEFAAKLLKADEARKIYEEIVRRKKDPALLEYAGFGLYRTRAFPLQPGKPAKVVVTYKNVCRKDHDLVEVWYPLNTEKFSAKPIESVRVRVDIKENADILSVYSPTHDLNVQRKAADHVVATYEAAQTLPTTDIQVFYKVSDKDVGASLLTWRPDPNKDGYFMLLVSPNPRTARTKVVPKDVVIVYDHSGSMSGKKIIQAREALKFVLNNLNDADRFNVVPYSDSVETFFEEPLVPADKANVAAAMDRLDRIDAAGGTNIHEALRIAMDLVPNSETKRPAYVIFLTDGLPTVGKTNEQTILADTKKANEAHARIFAFGVGYDVNVRLLDKLVRENAGKSDYVKPDEPIETKLSSLYNKIKNPVMTGLKLRIAGLKLSDMYPRELGDLFDGDQIVVVGRYDAAIKLGKALMPANPTLVINGTYEGKERAFEYPVTINPPGKQSGYDFVEKLWAVRRVGYLLDQIQLHGQSQEVIDELVSLSKRYGIMTPYTSFLADETTVLSSPDAVRGRARKEAKALEAFAGASGQIGAMNRQMLNQAARPLTVQDAPGKSGGIVFGHADKAAYEAGEVKRVSNVRQVGDQALYLRKGNIWIAANATDVDLDKAMAIVQIVDRYSEEYFELVRANTVAENRILASQQASEELVIRLRGQVYRIR